MATLSQRNFEAIFHLLCSLSNLAQLHLIGNSFFSFPVRDIADQISKLDNLGLNFRYPELHVVLSYLRTSKVKIFTYRGENEKREVRWTRLNEKEDLKGIVGRFRG